MRYTVTIVRCSDGAKVEHESDWPHDEQNFVFGWAGGGNYCCDCNRHIFFELEQGRESKDDDEACGHTRYTCPSAVSEDGRTVLLDLDPYIAKTWRERLGDGSPGETRGAVIGGKWIPADPDGDVTIRFNG